MLSTVLYALYESLYVVLHFFRLLSRDIELLAPRLSSLLSPQFVTVEDVPITLPSQPVDCYAIFQGNKSVIELAEAKNREVQRPEATNALLVNISSDCSTYVKLRKYLTKAVSAEERDFPIAFSLVVFRDTWQVERLLRAIYRPQNVYCIHVDLKATSMYTALASVSRCFDNVLMLTERLNIRWGKFSVLEAEIMCMRALMTSQRPFRYFINLTGQEFPLKTNLDLVRILKTFGGANDITGITMMG